MERLELFTTRKATLDKLGIKYSTAYDYGFKGTDKRHEFKVDTFTEVKIPLTAEEWCSLCMNEGDDYIGGCCGTTSACQDIVNGWFREGGYARVKELAELAELLSNHDSISDREIDFDSMPEEEVDGEDLNNLDNLDNLPWWFSPWEKIAILWHLVKDFYAPDQVWARPAKDPKDELDLMIRDAGYALRSLGYHTMFESTGNSDQGKAYTNVLLARAIPAIKGVFNCVEKNNPEPFEGVAIIDTKQGPREIVRNRLGSCIYKTKEEVEKLFKLWNEDDEQKEEGKENPTANLLIRRVRVSTLNGIEFLDDEPKCD